MNYHNSRNINLKLFLQLWNVENREMYCKNLKNCKIHRKMPLILPAAKVNKSYKFTDFPDLQCKTVNHTTKIFFSREQKVNMIFWFDTIFLLLLLLTTICRETATIKSLTCPLCLILIQIQTASSTSKGNSIQPSSPYIHL